ncbi:hypothetical protein E2C01_056994 [Portunus trituberculatus]|uniref:Uncharacterized protein n=1 Tax=Portunus trituberculatus TaxID=210409 RepID=A0A5B7H246_PORTR|nr:hypothetical protein [Portunus trituberculatus]
MIGCRSWLRLLFFTSPIHEAYDWLKFCREGEDNCTADETRSVSMRHSLLTLFTGYILKSFPGGLTTQCTQRYPSTLLSKNFRRYIKFRKEGRRLEQVTSRCVVLVYDDEVGM